MDRIEELMRNARPRVTVPDQSLGSPIGVAAAPAVHLSAVPASGGVAGAGGGIPTFTDDAGRSSASQALRDGSRNNRTVLRAAVAGLAAAAVITVGVVAGNVGSPVPAPAPAPAA